MTSEQYLTAKELAQRFEELNIRPCGYRAMCVLIAECPRTVGRTVRFSDAIEYLEGNREWKPFGREREGNPPISML